MHQINLIKDPFPSHSIVIKREVLDKGLHIIVRPSKLVKY
jgi:hypothetical protein